MSPHLFLFSQDLPRQWHSKLDDLLSGDTRGSRKCIGGYFEGSKFVRKSWNDGQYNAKSTRKLRE